MLFHALILGETAATGCRSPAEGDPSLCLWAAGDLHLSPLGLAGLAFLEDLQGELLVSPWGHATGQAIMPCSCLHQKGTKVWRCPAIPYLSEYALKPAGPGERGLLGTDLCAAFSVAILASSSDLVFWAD